MGPLVRIGQKGRPLHRKVGSVKVTRDTNGISRQDTAPAWAAVGVFARQADLRGFLNTPLLVASTQQRVVKTSYKQIPSPLYRPRTARDRTWVCVPPWWAEGNAQQNRKRKFLSRFTTASLPTASVPTQLPEYELNIKKSLPHLAGLAGTKLKLGEEPRGREPGGPDRKRKKQGCVG